MLRKIVILCTFNKCTNERIECMKYSNKFTKFSGLEGEKALILDQWLEQYQLKQALMSSTESLEDFFYYSKEEKEQLRRGISKFDKSLAVSQIRIWDSKMVLDNDFPSYFVILAKWMHDTWLIAPFSPFILPANEGEMKIDIGIPFCDVIQCWNARTVQSCFVERSWLVDVVSSDVTQAARDLFLNQIFGDKLPNEFDFLRGGPVLNFLDPRISYLQESKAQYAPLFYLTKRLEELREENRVIIYNFPKENKHKDNKSSKCESIAAADLERNETIKKKFSTIVNEKSCFITLYIESGENLELTISDNNENDSYDLEGYVIRNKVGDVISCIMNAHAFIVEGFDGTLLITKPDGYPITLTEILD